MLDKIVMLDKKDYPDWYDDKLLGGYNSLPKGWRKITEVEYVHQFCCYGYSHIEFRQALMKKLGPFSSVYLYFYNGPEGLALVPVLEDCRYKRFDYYAFGCKHEFESVNKKILEEKYPEHLNKYTPGNCCNNYVCKKCRKFMFQDSSD